MFHSQPTHVNEFIFLSSRIKRQQQLMQGAVFLAPNSASCVPQEAVIPPPHHPSASSGYVAVLSPAYFY